MTKLKIILYGSFIVNLPVTLVIIIITLCLTVYLDISWNGALIVGSLIGWIIWFQLVKVWVKLCLNKGATHEEIYVAGKLGLINFSRKSVFGKESE